MVAKKDTSLAVVYRAIEGSSDGKVYLYYISEENVVRRIVRSAFGQWIGDKRVPNAPPVTVGSQLPVVYCSGINHLFYMVGDGADNIQHICDSSFNQKCLYSLL